MANIAAIANGAWTSTSTWTGGVVPGSGDIAYSNNFTVIISSSVTVQALSNASGTGITAGGTFQLQNGANVTCTNANGILQGTASSNCITTSISAGQSATLSASITTTTGITVAAINHSTAGSLYLIGNYTPTHIPANTGLILNSSNGYLEIVGNVSGHSIGNTNATACVFITGNNSSTKIIGNVTGSTSTGTLNRGTFIAASAGILLIIGTVQGGSAGESYGAENTQTAGQASTLSVEGTCRGGTGGNGIGVGKSTSQITRVTGPILLSSNNIMGINALAWRFQWQNGPTYMEVPTINPSTGATVLKNLYTADNMPSGGYPITSNVRNNIVYGPTSEFTGSLIVPSPSSVALGVATDNTVGTAILTAANVRTAIGMASANLDAQLAPKASVDQVASIVQNSVSN